MVVRCHNNMTPEPGRDLSTENRKRKSQALNKDNIRKTQKIGKNNLAGRRGYLGCLRNCQNWTDLFAFENVRGGMSYKNLNC